MSVEIVRKFITFTWFQVALEFVIIYLNITFWSPSSDAIARIYYTLELSGIQHQIKMEVIDIVQVENFHLNFSIKFY